MATALDVAGAVVGELERLGLGVVDDLTGRTGGQPPDSAFAVTVTTAADRDGILLDTTRVAAQVIIEGVLAISAGQAFTEYRAAKIAHDTLLALPLALASIDAVLELPAGRRNDNDEVLAQVALRTLQGPMLDDRRVAEAVEVARTAGQAVLAPVVGVDEVVWPRGVAQREITEAVSVVECELGFYLDPFDPSAYRAAHEAMVTALRGAGLRVSDDGTGRVSDLFDQREPGASDIRLIDYGGWSIDLDPDEHELRMRFVTSALF